MAKVYNFTIDQGTTFSHPFKIEESVGGTFQPLDLTGVEITSQLRTSYADANAAATWSTATGEFTITGPAINGEFNLGLTEAKTQIPEGEYVYDIELKRPDGTKNRILQGTITITPQVTRDA